MIAPDFSLGLAQLIPELRIELALGEASQEVIIARAKLIIKELPNLMTSWAVTN